MTDNDQRVIHIGPRLKRVREIEAIDLADERLRDLAFQAVKLPSTLSRSEIEQLGLAVLTHMGDARRIV